MGFLDQVVIVVVVKLVIVLSWCQL